MVNRDGSPVLNFKMSSSKSQDGEQTMPVYHSNHSYLFTKVIERHPGLTKDELEKEFKSNVEGAYVTELLDEYGAFSQISRNRVGTFKLFVADEMIWRRYREYDLHFQSELKTKTLLRVLILFFHFQSATTMRRSLRASLRLVSA